MNRQAVVVVADGARARIFTLWEPDLPDIQGGPELREDEDLVNPEAELAQRERFSDVGGYHHTGRGASHGYDDHRGQHEADVDRRFARRVAERAANFAMEARASRCVVAAKAKMLGMLRREIGSRVGPEVNIDECARNLSKLPPGEIHAHLADMGLLPERRPSRLPEHRPSRA